MLHTEASASALNRPLSSDAVLDLIIVFISSSPRPIGSQRPPAPTKWVQAFGANPNPKPGLSFQGAWHCSFYPCFVPLDGSRRAGEP